MVGKSGDLIGAYGRVDGRLYGDRGGEWEHEGWWICEVAREERALRRVLIGPENPLPLLRVNNVCEASRGGDLYGEVSKVMSSGSLRELMSVGENICLKYGKIVNCFDLLPNGVDDVCQR